MSMARPLWLLLWLALWGQTAKAAFLTLTVATNGFGPAATPRVEVVVSGVVVFNARTGGQLTIPVNTTGAVEIRIRELPDYQEFVGWAGECAGVLASLPCTFGAGQNVGYGVTAVFRNRSGTLVFGTSSSTAGVSAPVGFGIGILSAPDGSTGDRVADTRPSAQSVALVAGNYVLRVDAASSGTCQMSPAAAQVNLAVRDGAQSVLNVAYRADECTVTVDLPQAGSQGDVTSQPAGIDCPSGVFNPRTRSPCAAYFPYLSTANLVAAPRPGLVFAGWEGGCTWALDPTCVATAVQNGSAKRPRFATASVGSANLVVTEPDIVVIDAGAGRVRVSLTLVNRGSDTAAQVRAELGPTAFGVFSEIPATVSDGGECNSQSICRWTLGDLAAGARRTVSFTVASTRNSLALRACALSTTPEADGSDNCVATLATVAGQPPTPAGPATAVTGPVPPADRAELKGTADVVMAQFTVRPPLGATGGHSLVGLTVKISGAGDDLRDIQAVRLYPDLDGNGLIDAAERAQALAAGRFDADDGQARLDFSPSALGSGRTYLVALDINATLAGGGFALPTFAGGSGRAAVAAAALSSLLLLLSGTVGRTRQGTVLRRGWPLLAPLALGLASASCGGGGGGSGGGGVIAAPVERSYRIQLTEVRVSDGAVVSPATGTPLAGAEIRVLK